MSKRWHADIKPDNILSVHGKFKLADPGFAHFVKKTDKIPMGEVLGGTETFGDNLEPYAKF
jgi:serine/threonine protein kinase